MFSESDSHGPFAEILQIFMYRCSHRGRHGACMPRGSVTWLGQMLQRIQLQDSWWKNIGTYFLSVCLSVCLFCLSGGSDVAEEQLVEEYRYILCVCVCVSGGFDVAENPIAEQLIEEYLGTCRLSVCLVKNI